MTSAISDYYAKGLDSSYYTTNQEKEESSTSSSKDVMGKDDFLALLIAQLKHQDPMDPVKNEDFAINLAQFSQLEQLININDKLTTENDTSYLANYLGHQVVLNTKEVQVSGGDGGQIALDLKQDAKSLTVQLLDSEGKLVESHELSDISSGKQTIELNGLTSADGTYTVNVTGINASGVQFNVTANAAGVVSGFVPGSDPVLLAGGYEVKPSDIKEVRA